MLTLIKKLKNIRFQTMLSTMLICMVSGIPHSYADFDPVNDDTDIFLANPNVAAQRPNVLLYVDNTANWNTAFTNEKNAMVGVVNNLSEQFNVGLMLFPETGSGWNNVDGGYPRFAVRQMTPDNKAALSGLVNNFDVNTDKGNNNTLSLGMVEVFRYFSGGNSRAGHDKVKSDYITNASHEATVATLGEHALPASPTSSSPYNSPIADSCQSNFVIYLSNGGANENASALAAAEVELAATGYDTNNVIPLSPNGQQGNWMDEWAKYMSTADISPLDGVQNVTFYTVEVDPVSTGQGPDMTALMKSVALNGNGQYFAVSSGNNGQAILNALNTIFTEIQAVNSVFASTTLPVSVNVRGTNLNQVYIGVFRPDENKNPRWFGNLKMYKLGFDSATSTLFLSDAAGTKAENPETGFINANSASFWTDSSSYWSYRSADVNGPGGISDAPDGDLVEKGGAAQQIREAYPSDQSSRELYTCNGSCAIGDSLSSTPFDTSNSDITNASLGLGTTPISTLTAFDTQNITAISDTKSVIGMTTASGGLFLNGITTDGVGQPVTNLTSISTKTITGMDNGSVVKSFNGLNRATGNPKDPVVAIINNHSYTNGQIVHITGVGDAVYNGSKVISVVDANTFKYSTGTSNPPNNPDFSSATATTTTTIVTVTVPNHGLITGNQVDIAGVVPTDFNGTNITINKIDNDTFSFITASALAPVSDFSSATVSANSTTATATVAAHGFSSGNTVVISGASVAGFDGSHSIVVRDANNFSFPIATPLPNDSSGTALVYPGTVTATVDAPAHAFADGQVVSISGSDPITLNGSFPIFNVVPGVSFEYTAPGSGDNISAVPFATAGVSNLVFATVANHGFNLGDVIFVDGAVPNEYNGIHTINWVFDNNSFRYALAPTETPLPADVSAATVRLNSPTAFATMAGHGYTNGDLIRIQGATPNGYNKPSASITVVDANTFKYALTSTIGTAATGSITASKKGITAKVRAANHGFTNADAVDITGATPSTFNGTAIAINVLDNDNFTYSIGPSIEGDAFGSMFVSSGSGNAGARSNLIDWVRGEDNQEDENQDGFNTDVRSSIHGDVLHSRPAVVNYNRHGNDDDVYVYYGSNDGIFRAIKGGFNQSDELIGATEPFPGQEAWGFIPEEFFSKFQRLRNNEPFISSSNKKPYFADGTITVHVEDNSGPGGPGTPDGKIDVSVDDNTNPDKVHLFASMRRGGRFIYALDVSDPSDPKLLWKKSNADSGFGELGYTWSAPTVTRVAANSGNPVIVMGAGYDPAVEDIDPASITASTATSVMAGAAGPYNRTMGRGIFVLDAADGDILWQAGPVGGDPGTGHPYVEVPGMDYSIPSDMVVITDRNGAVDNRAYVGDTGGQMWRVDLGDANPANWKVTKIAAIADTSGLPGDNSGLRKFLFPPDVVYGETFDAVLIGSGDREHPFDTAVQNRFYMFKDVGIAADTPLIDDSIHTDTGTTTVLARIDTFVESNFFDATSNCIQAASACSGVGEELDSTTASGFLESKDGWYITLETGEKVVGNSVTLNNITFFNTNQPSSAVVAADCSSDLGVAKQYKVNFLNATAFSDQNIDGFTDADDRFTTHTGGGYLPSPVPVVVEIDGEIHEGVISGVAVDEPPGATLNARMRKFWYKEQD